MRIRQVKVFGYGKWMDQTFNFDKKNLQIVYGNNESGKTTLLSLIMGILFGYKDGRGNSYEQYIPKGTNSYGGSISIVTDNDRNFLIKRISGTHGGNISIYDLDNDCEADSKLLNKILGPIDRETFEHIFYFGNLNVKNISKLDNNQLIEQIQKVGFVGSDEWITISDKLDKNSRELYAPTGRKPPLNKKLKAYKELLIKIDNSKGNLNEYKKCLYDSQIATKAIENLNNKIKTLDNEIYSLNNHRNNWILYEKLINSSNLSIRHGFDDSSKNTLYSIKNSIELNNNQINIIDNQISELNNQINKSNSLKFYEQNCKTIDYLYGSSQSINKSVNLFYMKKQIIDDYKTKQRATFKENKIRLSEQDKNNIIKLSHQTINNGIKNNLKNNIVWLLFVIAGIILFIISPGWFKLFGFALAILSICLYFVKIKLHLNHLSKQIDFYKQKYGFNRDDPKKWLSENNNISDKFQDDIKKYIIELTEIRKNLDNYFAKWSFAEQYININDDYINNLHLIENFIKTNKQLITENDQLTKTINKYLLQKNNLLEKKEKLNNQLMIFLKQRNVSDVDEFNSEFNKQQKIVKKYVQYHNIKNQLGENEIKLLKEFKNKDEINSQLNNKKNLQTTLKQQLLDNSKILEKNKININHLTADGTYQELEQKKANLETEINGMVDKWLTMKLSGKWIDRALNIASADRIPMFQQKAKEYFGLLTNHNYIKITYYKNKLKVTRKDKVQFDIGELSRGTIKQLYLSLILSLAVVFGRDYKLPIIIDDGFNEFDIDRSQNAYELLDKISNYLQVIYVTCNKDILDYYNSEEIINLNDE